MLTLEEYGRLIADAIEKIEYPQTPASLFEPVRYTLESGGKRLRPTLLLAACEALGGDAGAAMPQALGIEMFHNFSLLHDDGMDNAEVRRGRLTVHQRWSTSQAILSGDAMLTMATALTAQCPGDLLPSLMKLFNDTAMEVYEGQQFDVDFESRRNVTVAEYIKMIRLKTSVLLGCACAMGAMVAGADEKSCRAFYDYGVDLGLAFQLRDDWLDTYGDPLLFGKEIGGDIVNEKKTWLLITAMTERSEELQAILAEDLDPAERVRQVVEVYDALRLSERCDKLIKGYVDKALTALSKIELSAEAQQFFVDLARKSASRTH